MVPIKTVQGLSIVELQKIINERSIYIWGTGALAEAIIISLVKSGLKPAGLLDNRTKTRSIEIRGRDVWHPSDIFEAKSLSKDNTFIIVATEGYKKEAERICVEHGYVKGIDYIDYYKISRPHAVVDVSGHLENRILNSPLRNIDSLIPEGCMTFDAYRKVFDKLQHDIPLLTWVDLSSWGEPLYNKQLHEIIKYTEKLVPCSITTHLLTVSNLDNIIKSEPHTLNIIVHGCEDTCDKMVQEGSWSELVENMRLVSQLKAKHKAKTNINIKVQQYKFINPNGKDTLSRLCNDLSFNMHYDTPYLNPYEKYLEYSLNKKHDRYADHISNQFAWNLEKTLKLANKDKNMPCLSQRIFPIINWNLSVSLCHTYYRPIIANNYLETSWSELLNERHSQKQCELCQGYSLHRLDLNVLHRRNNVYK